MNYNNQRDQLLLEIAENTKALISEVRTSTSNPDLKTTHRHRVRHAGLLIQLIAALEPGRGIQDGSGRSTAPGTRSPSNPTASNALDTIIRGNKHTPGARALRNQLLDGKQPKAQTLTATIAEIRSLATTCTNQTQLETTNQTMRAWIKTARTALGLDIPLVTLKDLTCPYCQGPLRVAADASTDVWCHSPQCRDENGKPRAWQRKTWHLMLQAGATGHKI